MKILLITMIIIKALINISCSGEKEAQSIWGIEQPSIVTKNESYLLTDYHTLNETAVSINDKIVFNNKYEKENITLEVISTCNGYVQKFSSKLKSVIFIRDLIPYQAYLDLKKGEVWDCGLMFRALNQTGGIHEFNSNTLKIKSNEVLKSHMPLIIKKYDDIKGVAVKFKKNTTLFTSQLRFSPLVEQAALSVACENFIIRIKNLSNFERSLNKKMFKYPTNKCVAVLSDSEGIKKSQTFILKKRVTPLKINVLNSKNNKLLNYGSIIKVTKIRLKNMSSQKIKVAISEKNLEARFLMQYNFLKQYKQILKAFKPQMAVKLSPYIYINNKRVNEKNGIFAINMKVKEELEVELRYIIGSHKKLEIKKKINCPIGNTTIISGYKLLYPSEIEVFQINKANLPSKDMLGPLNVIQKDTIVFYEDSLTYKYNTNSMGCSKADVAKKFKGLLPGLPGNSHGWP